MTYNDAVHYLMHEVSIFDTKNKVLYFLDVSGEPKIYHGIQIFHVKADKGVVVKALNEGYSLTDFCLERIPAPVIYAIAILQHAHKIEVPNWTHVQLKDAA